MLVGCEATFASLPAPLYEENRRLRKATQANDSLKKQDLDSRESVQDYDEFLLVVLA